MFEGSSMLLGCRSEVTNPARVGELAWKGSAGSHGSPESKEAKESREQGSTGSLNRALVADSHMGTKELSREEKHRIWKYLRLIHTATGHGSTMKHICLARCLDQERCKQGNIRYGKEFPMLHL